WILPSAESKGVIANGIQIGWLARVFEGSIRLAVKNPLRAIAVSLILPVLGFAAFPTLTAQFFPGVERNQFYIEVSMPPGTAISETTRVALEMDEVIRADEGLRSVYWSLGTSGPAFYYNIVGGRSQEPGFAQAMITTETDADAARLVGSLQEQFDRDFPQAQVIVRGLVQGPPVDAPVEINIQGQDIETLRALGD
ncbi:MAG: efflux RND transporter permease subunit, partial [Pseudomonadota bacterium]